ncbi:MAG: nucleotide disphospho-sugar-binding domain-containing protein [Hydrogenophilaceae bacterium]
MRVLLICPGSAGNALPFAGLGATLAARGHEVILLGDRYLEELSQRLGLGWAPIQASDGPPVEGGWASSTPRLIRQLVRRSAAITRSTFRAIEALHLPGETVMAAQGWLFGARIAQDRLGIPLATVHLQPMMFGRLHEPGGLPEPMGFALRWLRQRAILGLAQHSVGRDLNVFRRELGLPPVHSILEGWWRSTQLVLAMFPSWFAQPRQDWPAQTILAGFPLFDELMPCAQWGEMERFLAEGEPPIVFSQPSLIATGPRFFDTAAEITRRLGRRAILLSLKTEQDPPSLPENVAYFGYVPLDRLLPHAAAVVHHGGMGTIAQALVAGVPQLTQPRFLDQHDNSRRLAALGVSRNLGRTGHRTGRMLRALEQLISADAVGERCRHFAALSRSGNGLETAGSALERLALHG